MTIKEAKSIIKEYEFKSVLTSEEEFMLTEAFNFLIDKTKDTRYMVRLGGYYYEIKNFDLALKYYEMADSYGDDWAPEGLGYIWYYGRTGEKDYEKAFKYYSKAAKNGYIKSEMKIADMYKNGYYVDKDYDKYCEIIEKLYKKVKDGAPWYEKTDILIRFAKIRKEQGRTQEAIDLLLEARHYLAYKIESNPFFGDLNVMKWLLDDLYEMTEIDLADLNIFDLFYLSKKPCKVSFMYDDKEYIAESVAEDDGSISVHFNGKWYRDVDDFFTNAEINGERVPVLYSFIYAVKVI